MQVFNEFEVENSIIQKTQHFAGKKPKLFFKRLTKLCFPLFNFSCGYDV